ncbi:ABC transporter ATP-binding protein [Plantactinospora sp. GCM10030261]|uniref:ABC transporter ATP-binding protein n=1 Tax=Plantactinospora sp. GCM10030261 TaxID=3273420 RepID=UPI003610CF7C
MTSGVVLRAHGLIAGYHSKPVIGPIDLAVADNETIALIGPNGVGKSTLLKTLTGLITPLGGTISHQGRSITSAGVHNHTRNGLVFVGEHRANVLRTLTVQDNLDLAAATRKRSYSVDPLDLFPKLGQRRRQLGGTLSGGELQMLSLAMALALSPTCLLLDEPSAGLAPVVLDDLRQALTNLRSTGLALIIAEQRPDVVHGLCDRIAIVSESKLTYLPPGTDLSSQAVIDRYFSHT